MSLEITRKRAAIFIDRDGTINEEKNYLHRIEDFEFIPGTHEAIKLLKDAGYLVIVVSNQSGIARGYFDEAAVDRLHEHIQQELKRYDTTIDGFYYCPHHPEKGLGDYKVACDCRKGAPGMLLQAAEEHNIDLEKSFMVGDKLADIEAGAKAGCKSILVLTGYGDREKSKPGPSKIIQCKNLYDAAYTIINEKLS